MDPMVIQTIITIAVPVAYVLGVAGAILWPFFNAKKEDPTIEFDWEYIWWQVGFGVVGAIPMFIANSTIQQLDSYAAQGWIGILLALVAGYGAARAGRETQKTKG